MRLPVSELMTRALITCVATDRVDAMLARMTLNRIRHMPVLEGGKLAGIVSIGDLVHSRLGEKELEASVLLDAIRNSAQGMDDLTNYVFAITNAVSSYTDGNPIPKTVATYGYTPTSSYIDNAPMSPSFPLNTGFRIVGLLSTPKYIPWATGGINYCAPS